MIMSFRLRLFFTAAAIVAVVLALVMLTGWSRVMDFELGRLDSRLCSEARRLAVESFPADQLPRLEIDIVEKLHLTAPDQLLLQFVDTSTDRRYQSAGWDGTLLPESLGWSPLVDPASAGQPGSSARRRHDPSRGECSLASIASQNDSWRAARSDVSGLVGVVAANLKAPKAEIQAALFGALLVEIPIALVLTALGAWLLAAFTIKPVNRLRESMKAVTPAALDQRLSEFGEDQEFKDLISAYNTMLERLQRSFQQASRFSADAAHELKTPLTILRGRIEQIRRKTGSEELHAELSDLLDEVGRLSAITRKLLLLSQADAGKIELSQESVHLTELLNALVVDAQMVVDDRKLSSSISAGLIVNGDAVLLRQLLNNLLSNCVRYSLAGGFIDVSARQTPGFAEIVFSNSCRAVGPVERTRFFERFFRGDASHSRQLDGTGLGLSLALEIARAHRGSLTLLPGSDDEVRLQLLLPIE